VGLGARFLALALLAGFAFFIPFFLRAGKIGITPGSGIRKVGYHRCRSTLTPTGGDALCVTDQ
jgi:hypothetical protein